MLLYKYFSPERIDFLTTKLVRFTQPGMFNDPFDTLPVITGYDAARVKKLVEKNARDIASNMNWENQGQMRELKMKALDLASKELAEQYARDPSGIGMRFQTVLRKKMDNQIGILCLCENHRSILMWSHYAKEHKGFVVGFDTNDDFFGHRTHEPDEIGQLLRVNYVNDRPAISVDVIENKEIPVPDILFSKNQEWSYEHEWRIIRFLKDSDANPRENIYLFKAPPSAIREVILGSQSQPELAERVAIIREREPSLKHVKFFKTALSRTRFEMDISEL